MPILRPKTDEEREAWMQWTAEGWAMGIQQADQIYRHDVARLSREYEGMALYQKLVRRGLLHELYLAKADLGVTGGGEEMRIGEQVVRITAPARFNGSTAVWDPIVID